MDGPPLEGQDAPYAFYPFPRPSVPTHSPNAGFVMPMPSPQSTYPIIPKSEDGEPALPYPLHPVSTCDPDDFGPSSAPPAPGFIYNPAQPHLLSYAPEPVSPPESSDSDEKIPRSSTMTLADGVTPFKSYVWKNASASDCSVPGMILVGTDLDGSPIFAGRAWHNGDVLPAKIVPARCEAYVAYGGDEVRVDQFEVLIQQTLQWVWSSGGSVPGNAVTIGNTSDGEALFMGRVHHGGVITPGKIHGSHGCCYFPFDGRENKSCDYEVLVLA